MYQPYQSSSILVRIHAYASAFPAFRRSPARVSLSGVYLSVDVENVQTTGPGKRSLPRKEYRGKYEEQTEIAPHAGRMIEKNFHRSNRGVAFNPILACAARGRVRDFVANRRDITRARVRRDVRAELALCSILLSKQNVPRWLAFPLPFVSVLSLAILRPAKAVGGAGGRGRGLTIKSTEHYGRSRSFSKGN